MVQPSITPDRQAPLRALIDEAVDTDSQLGESQQQLIDNVESTFRELEAWVARLEENAAAEAERWNEAEANRQAADEHRRRLEHDLKLARTRVGDLEKTLQERTEELLRAQAANNALAAELQAAELQLDDLDEGEEAEASTSDQEPAATEETEGEDSVSARFAKLRERKMAG